MDKNIIEKVAEAISSADGAGELACAQAAIEAYQEAMAGCQCSNVMRFDGRARYRGEPTYVISFSTNGCIARKQWPDGNWEAITVTEAMREFDKLQAKEA